MDKFCMFPDNIPHEVIDAFSKYKMSIFDILGSGLISNVIPDIINESRKKDTEIDKNMISRNTSVQTIMNIDEKANLNERIIVNAKIDELINYLFRYIA